MKATYISRHITHAFTRILSIIAIAAAMTTGLTSCIDDFDYRSQDGFPEGETTVNFSLDFTPMAEAVLSTRAASGTPGDAIKDIHDICVVAYDASGNLVDGFPRQAGNISITEADRDNTMTSDGSDPAEAKTGRAEFSLSIPYGRYYLYAVANLGYARGCSSETVLREHMTADDPDGDILTRQGLENFVCSWNETNIAANCQMAGYFTDSRAKHSPKTGDAVTSVDIRTPDVTLHSWMRRLASKVTIDFDGSGLRHGIKVFIKKATIHNLPVDCRLWTGNYPTAANSVKKDNTQEIDYTKLTNTGIGSATGTDWPFVSQEQVSLPGLTDPHAEKAGALFFYENMQGVKEGENKKQEHDGNGNVAGKDDICDNVPLGTYIEVEAYYVSTALNNIGRGKITYRCMLGKDYVNDFNSERNFHYKLTLCFNGNANDYDWHIEYDQEKGIELPNPYYISYLYNRSMRMPVKVVLDKGDELESLTAEVIDNRWGPWNTNLPGEEWNAVVGYKSDGVTPIYKKEKQVGAPALTDNLNYWSSMNIAGTNLQNGFLSLKKTHHNAIHHDDSHPVTDFVTELNKQYYYGSFSNSFYIDLYGNRDKSKRSFITDVPISDAAKSFDSDNAATRGDGIYTAQRDPANPHIYNYRVPLYTLPKQMNTTTGYTGNNPYVQYARSSRVRFVAKTKWKKIYVKEVQVLQVPRIVNPKGIYRPGNNNTPFDVELMELMSETATSFTAFKSDGPWKAYVQPGSDPTNLVSLSGYDGTTVDEIDGKKVICVAGNSQSTIRFRINFNGKTSDDSPRSALIKIEYNNYSCEHVIMVRQGYGPTTMGDGHTTRWYTLNVRTKDGGRVDDPRDEGSLFRYLNWDQPIASKSQVNNIAANPNWLNVKPEHFIGAGKLDIEGGGQTDWDGITGDKYNASSTWGKNVATMAQYHELIGKNDKGEDIDDYQLRQAFGVLYAGTATKCAASLKDAYQWRRDEAGNSGRGMRGCFVYNFNTGQNIFFPIGASGYGHRKGMREPNRKGVLRYAAGRDDWYPTTSLDVRPLFYDIFRSQGAIYWANDLNYKTKIGLDVNYYTFDFNSIDYVNLFVNTGTWNNPIYAEPDACFLRQTAP